MAKRALSAVFGLAFLVTAQGQESSRSSSSRTGSSPADAWPSSIVANAGDPALDNPSHFRGGNSVSSATSDDTNIVEEIITSLLPRDSQSAYSSAASERSFAPTADPAVVYILSSSSRESPPTSSSSVDSTSVNVFKDASYSAGTVDPTEERATVQRTALEFSTSTNQVDDTAETSSTTASSSGKRATSTDQTASKSQGNDSASDIATIDPSFRSPLLYACAVLGVAGLVGAVFAFRAKNKRDVSADWRAASEVAAVMPPLSRVAPVSQVHVVIDDHNFAIL